MKYLPAILAYIISINVFADGLPDNLMIVGYDGSAWHPYVSQKGEWEKIDYIENPASITRSAESNAFIYKADTGDVYWANQKEHKKLYDSSKSNDGVTQLRADDRGAVFVKLIDGKSSDTQLSHLDLNGQIKTFYSQASAQFHPIMHGNELYYAHVSCRLICNPIIQDVWRRNIKTYRTEQLTMLNSTTYLHGISKDGGYGVISSNHHGFYHIALLDLNKGGVTWLTSGQVTDSNPVLASDNRVYFIRRMSTGTTVHSLPLGAQSAKESDLLTHSLPHGVTKIRYMEFSY
ncbi:MAG: hypothetical protein ACRBB6_07655 [Neptuniibacter sp.]